MLINIKTDIFNANGQGYLTWTPRNIIITLLDVEGDPNPTIKISSTGVVDLQISNTMMQPGGTDLTLTFMAVGDSVEIWTSGVFGSPSSTYGDARLSIEDVASGDDLWSEPMMVRIRKNANQLSAGERDAFLEALGTSFRSAK